MLCLQAACKHRSPAQSSMNVLAGHVGQVGGAVAVIPLGTIHAAAHAALIVIIPLGTLAAPAALVVAHTGLTRHAGVLSHPVAEGTAPAVADGLEHAAETLAEALAHRAVVRGRLHAGLRDDGTRRGRNAEADRTASRVAGRAYRTQLG